MAQFCNAKSKSLISVGMPKKGSSRNAKDCHALYDNKPSMSRTNLMQPPEVFKSLADIVAPKNMFRFEPLQRPPQTEHISDNQYSSQPQEIACDLHVLSKRWRKNLLTKWLQKDMGSDVFFWIRVLSRGAN